MSEHNIHVGPDFITSSHPHPCPKKSDGVTNGKKREKERYVIKRNAGLPAFGTTYNK
jgi:hypothetical protein